MEITITKQDLVEEVYEAAKHQGKAVEAFIEEAITKQLWSYREKRIWDESEYWYSLPSETRNQYQDRYVAVHNKEIVDIDPDRRTLYIRIRERFGNEPVMITEGGDRPMSEYRITNVFIDR